MVGDSAGGVHPVKVYDGIDSAALFDEIDSFLGRYVIYPSEEMRHAHTLWIVHTHLMELWDSTPRIYFKSPEPGSGKTRALEVSEHLVHRGFIALNMSPASLIRRLGDAPENRPTLLVDEVDTIFGPKAQEHEDIRGIINAGHRRSGKSTRCVQQGNQWVVQDFPAYGAVGLAGLDDLPDTIMTRSIVVSLKKRKVAETVKPWRNREDEPKAKELGARLAEWATAVKQELWDGTQYVFEWPDMPDGVADRTADCWEALLVCARLAGGEWPLTSNIAALAALADSREDGESRGVLLLTDIQTIFKASLGQTSVVSAEEIAKDALKTPTLLRLLSRIEESPWGSLHRDGSCITARDLAQLLKPYGVKSENIWWGKESNSKGYYRRSFADAWARYVAPGLLALESPHPTNNGQAVADAFLKSTTKGY